MQALVSAKQSGEAPGIIHASRNLAAMALVQIGDLEALRGSANAAVESYRRSLQFEDAPNSHVTLALAYQLAGDLDAAMSDVANVLVADPHNADAWLVQGQIWSKKRDYPRAAESFTRSSQLRPAPGADASRVAVLLQSKQRNEAMGIISALLRTSNDRAASHALLSDLYRDANYLDNAEHELSEALRLDPALPRAHYRLGLISLARHEWVLTPESRDHFAKASALDSQDFFSQFALGLVQFFDQQYSGAEPYLKAAREIAPEWPESWLYLGLTAYASGDKNAASEDLQKAIELTGGNGARGNFQIRRAYYTLGRLYSEQERKSEAADAVHRFRELQGEMLLKSASIPEMAGSGMAQMAASTAAFRALPQLEADLRDVAIALDSGHKWPEAVTSHATQEARRRYEKRRVELASILAAALNDLGAAEARQEQFSQALAHFQEAERWHADTPGLMRNLGMAAARVSDYGTAARALRPVVAQNLDDNIARSMLGMSLFATNEFAEAAQTFSPLGDSALDRPELAYTWAASLVKLNRYAEARGLLEKLETRQLSPETLILVAQTWSQMGDYARTVVACRKAVQQDPKHLRAHYIAALALIRQDRPVEAAAELRQELQLNPEDVEAEYHLAFVLLQQSQTDEALRLLRSVLARDPEHAEANYELGKQLLSNHDPQDAIGYLEAAARLKPGFEPVHYQLQAAYRSAGRKEDADREAKLYRELKAKSRNITLPPPRAQQVEETESSNPN
ncbi:MAG TPA: tetratricopeptide repeat protein [Terriglobales bacterium]|nr:tetratricopeptide repeat protein [Terriglobales bacterium]